MTVLLPAEGLSRRGTRTLHRIPRLRIVGCLVGLATFLVVLSPASAHHSYTGIDRGSVVAFQGTVKRFSWRNPHVYITVESTDESGQLIEWELETGGTPILARSGWTADSQMPGDTVQVRGHPERETGRRYALLMSIEKEDGTVLSQSARGSQSTERATELSGIWKSRAESFAPIEPLSSLYESFNALGRTAKGITAQEQYDPQRDNQTALCVGYSVLVTLASPHYLNELSIGEDTVILRNEWFDSERIVYMDGRGHPENGERTLNGHSIGRWEDGALVVDTRLFREHRSPYGTGLPSGTRKHVVERFSLNADGTSLAVDVSLEDPEYLTEIFTGSLNWDYTPDLELYRYDCDPEVAGKFGPG